MVDIKTLLPELRSWSSNCSRTCSPVPPQTTRSMPGCGTHSSRSKRVAARPQAFEVWREDYLDQVAVAWVLACVFVRFMEDNHLIDECWLAGEGDRRKLAEGHARTLLPQASPRHRPGVF